MIERWQTFWGEQGRIGLINRGELAGKFVLIYPDTMPEWWVVVVEKHSEDSIPGDQYIDNTASVEELVESWSLSWLPQDACEEGIERAVFGWRPLEGKSWIAEEDRHHEL